jgi:hypothetical protein
MAENADRRLANRFTPQVATAADNAGCVPQPKFQEGLLEILEALFCCRIPAVFQQNRWRSFTRWQEMVRSAAYDITQAARARVMDT